MSLTGLNILVTRPQAQGEALSLLVTELGGKAWHYPVMDIVSLDAEAEAASAQQCKQLIMDLDQFQHIIFVSTNAVSHGLQWIDQYWAQLPIGVNWYGIGEATCTELSMAGIPLVTDSSGNQSGAMNSEALLQHPLLQKLAHQKVLIVRGIGGRDHLASHLSQRGATVHFAECYRRSLVDKPLGDIASLIKQQNIHVVCVNSGESLQNYCQLAGDSALPDLQKIPLVVPGMRVADMATNLGFKAIIVAENAGDKAVTRALQSVKINTN